MKPTKSGLFQFPRSFNLDGPPGQSGHLLVLSSSGEGVDGGSSGDEAAGAGAGSSSSGGSTDGTSSGVLRLAVSLMAGPPVRALIRSPELGATEFSSEIRATQRAGFKVRFGEVCCRVGVGVRFQ